MKRAHLVAVGSRGDVEPCVALACGLRRAGWSVRLAALEPFRPLSLAHDVPFLSLGDLPGAFQRAPRLVPRFGLMSRALFWAAYRRALPRHLARLSEAARGADVVVYTGLAFPAARAARAAGAVSVALGFVPGVPTGAHVHPLFARGRTSVHPAYNRATYALEDAVKRALTVGAIPLPARPSARLVAVSPALVPRPVDWPDDVVQTGAFERSDPVQPPDAALARFLEEGPPPVHVGFGSMPPSDAARASERAVEALRRIGRRGVLVTGWGGLAAIRAPHVRVVDAVDHRWLFPRVAATVHHGGVGTVMASLRAGAPSVLAPHGYDQRFWAALLRERGLAHAPIGLDFSADSLASAIHRTIASPSIRARLAETRAALREERGVEAAVRTLEALAAGHSSTMHSSRVGMRSHTVR